MEIDDRVDHFHTIDQTNNPDFFIKFVDEGNSLETVQACKRIMSSLLNLQHDQSVLDVGCGTGDDVLSIAGVVGGTTGYVVGVDSSEKMIAEARKRNHEKIMQAGGGGRRGTEIKLPVEFYVGNANHQLDFSDNTFDCSRAERLLMHLDDPTKAISEMVRVTKPAGRIVVFDLDWDGIIINHNNRILTRKVIHLMCDNIKNGWIGRQLPTLFKQAGLKNINTIAHTIIPHFNFFIQICNGMMKNALQTGALTENEYNQMWSYLEKTNLDGSFLVAIPGFIVCGQKT
jgi:ubiquinone/menaquinone biosynthesis C-methylase UbiE